MVELRGVVIKRDGLDKYIKVVARKDYPDMYVTIEKKANVPINRELIMSWATGHFGIPAEQITWPHHIEVSDIS